MTNDHEQKYKLIEYFLNLLPVLELSSNDLEALMHRAEPLTTVSLPNADSLWIAYEIMQFMEEMPGGFFIYRADGEEEMIYANKALLRIFQCCTLKEFRSLVGNSFRGMVYPEDLDEVERSITEQVASSQYDLDYVEYRITRKDGQVRWLEDYGHFIHTDTVGDFFYVFAIDATEKRQRQMAEKSVLIQESRLKDEKLKNLIQAHDRERNLIHQEHLRRLEVIEGLSMNYESILYVDLDLDSILPYRLSTRTQHQFNNKLKVQSFSRFTRDYVAAWVHPEDRVLVSDATAPEYIRRKLDGNKTFYTNYRILNGDEIQYLQLRVVNVGSPEHISQIVLGYRRVDEEFRRELEQKQVLEEALSNANLAIIAKNTFLSNMSHDMRTPLNAIFGFTALTKKNLPSNSPATEYLDKIETAGHQLLDLINKVLELSWTESNDLQLDEREWNLNDIMQEIAAALSPLARDKNIILTLDTPALPHPAVHCDGDRIRQLLSNLVHNAITYTGPGGTVSLAVAELEPTKNQDIDYRFTVRDSGIGIGPDFLAHIYEPFEREKNTTFSGIHGTGLGLTITKSIVDKLGGHIDVDSTPGKGTTFTVTLPLRAEGQNSAAASNLFAQLIHQKILLVEDNEINLEIETELLHDLGFQIESAENGLVALERIKNAHPGEYGLILMDIQMPVMNGWEAAKAIRALEDPALSDIPIIALSANAFESDIRISRESGINAHLTKPVDIPLLLESIGKIL